MINSESTYEQGERHTVLPTLDVLSKGDTTRLDGMLLPGEHVVRVAQPHLSTIIAPSLKLFVALILTAYCSKLQLHPIVNGHHQTVNFSATSTGSFALLALGLVSFACFVSILSNAVYFNSLRIVATNRRAVIAQGIIGRNFIPLDIGTLARYTLSQGILGRIFNFGTIKVDPVVKTDFRLS